MNADILKLIREKGLLLEKEIFDIIGSLDDVPAAISLLDTFEKVSGQKIITKSLLSKNFAFARKFIRPSEGELKIFENVFVRLGITLEISKEQAVISPQPLPSPETRPLPYQVFYAETRPDKKIEVPDFTNHFRTRYQQLQRILLQRPELSSLVSINKISGDRQTISIIGIVSDKHLTKNKNLIVRFEDLTGSINVLFRQENLELFNKAQELQLDDVVAVKAAGSSDMLFAFEIYYPDAYLPQKTRFNEEISIAFISDVHAGSEWHLGKQFERFFDWLNGPNEDAKKIRYIFFVGDNIDGVGIFPGQESFLALKSMKLQYELLASYLRRVPKHITMFMCPGQHDASRVAEPQPIIDKKYAEPLYSIENLILVTNPTLVKLIEKETEFKVLMYHGASIHSFIDEIQELRFNKAHKTPAKAVRHMLKRRHLAPSHSSVIYIPQTEKDPLVIQEVPDVLCTGEVHRLDIENYNGILIITGSCWQTQTPFEEKVGNLPDPCKVPVLNLKTRELKIFDFSDEESRGEGKRENE